ncbi:ABC transporter ATP-binding protein [Dyella sp. M7H15-1]|uniref:ATP-binding cassette domain-containing protein n=1 Tax=Dyella sp. M7H15-1 TaxID=2501295 RepID=UPI001004E8F7|nr:ABC transporter ATP-binding protein [Dyella sp. M7H15-1]QAU25098.1 ABC transporter ATP-binding protein [Dyella sp. M7H15-1]
MELDMTPVISIEQLCFSYGARSVLQGIEVSIGVGELIALIGANASGKSTLINLVAGLLRGSSGSVVFSGWREGQRLPIGYAVAPERLPKELTGYQAMELVAAALHAHDLHRALAYAKTVDLEGQLGRSLSSYSLGTKQKLAIALALIGCPQLLLLDESLNGLDIYSVGKTLAFLNHEARQSQLSTLLVTHNLDLAQHYADRVWLLEQGSLVKKWTPQDLACMRRRGTSLSREVLDRALGDLAPLNPAAAPSSHA